MKNKAIVSILTSLLFCGSVAFSQTTQPTSPEATQAIVKREAAVKKAQEVFNTAKLAADQTEVKELNAALIAAMNAKNADEVIRIRGIIETVQAEVRKLTFTQTVGERIGDILEGTWKEKNGWTVKFNKDGTVNGDKAQTWKINKDGSITAQYNPSYSDTFIIKSETVITNKRVNQDLTKELTPQ